MKIIRAILLLLRSWFLRPYPRSRGTIAFVGRPVIDVVLPVTGLHHTDPGILSFDACGASHRIACAAEKHVQDKCTLMDPHQIDPLLRVFGNARMPGGGAVNSVVAAAHLDGRARRHQFTLLSETEVDEFQSTLSVQGIEALALGDSAALKNLVLIEKGNAERHILRNPADNPLAGDWLQRLAAWQPASLACVLINSPKSTRLADMMMQRAQQAGAPLFAVLSKSLPEEFRLNRLLPQCSVAVANLQEFAGLCDATGIACPKDENAAQPDELIAPLRHFARLTCGAKMVITLGAKGCLYSSSSGDLAHLSFTPSLASGINGALHFNPGIKNGSGDAFAAYLVLAWLQKPGLTAVRGAMLHMAHRFGIARATNADVNIRDVTRSCGPPRPSVLRQWLGTALTVTKAVSHKRCSSITTTN